MALKAHLASSLANPSQSDPSRVPAANASVPTPVAPDLAARNQRHNAGR